MAPTKSMMWSILVRKTLNFKISYHYFSYQTTQMYQVPNSKIAMEIKRRYPNTCQHINITVNTHTFNVIRHSWACVCLCVYLFGNSVIWMTFRSFFLHISFIRFSLWSRPQRQTALHLYHEHSCNRCCSVRSHWSSLMYSNVDRNAFIYMQNTRMFTNAKYTYSMNLCVGGGDGAFD